MCYGCWKKAGKPLIENEKVNAAIPLIEKLYTMTSVGGNLHIVTDDWNCSDDHIRSCQGFVEDNITDAGRDQVAVEKQLIELLAAMSENERYSALARWEGFD